MIVHLPSPAAVCTLAQVMLFDMNELMDSVAGVEFEAALDADGQFQKLLRIARDKYPECALIHFMLAGYNLGLQKAGVANIFTPTQSLTPSVRPDVAASANITPEIDTNGI